MEGIVLCILAAAALYVGWKSREVYDRKRPTHTRFTGPATSTPQTPQPKSIRAVKEVEEEE